MTLMTGGMPPPHKRTIVIAYMDITTGKMLSVQGVINRDDFSTTGSLFEVVKMMLRNLLRTADEEIKNASPPSLSEDLNTGNVPSVLARFFRKKP